MLMGAKPLIAQGGMLEKWNAPALAFLPKLTIPMNSYVLSELGVVQLKVKWFSPGAAISRFQDINKLGVSSIVDVSSFPVQEICSRIMYISKRMLPYLSLAWNVESRLEFTSKWFSWSFELDSPTERATFSSFTPPPSDKRVATASSELLWNLSLKIALLFGILCGVVILVLFRYMLSIMASLTSLQPRSTQTSEQSFRDVIQGLLDKARRRSRHGVNESDTVILLDLFVSWAKISLAMNPRYNVVGPEAESWFNK